MISNYIFGSTAVLLVYDITNHQARRRQCRHPPPPPAAAAAALTP